MQSRLDQILTALFALKDLGVTPGTLRMSQTISNELRLDRKLSHNAGPPYEFDSLLGIPIEIQRGSNGRLLSPNGDEIDENEPQKVSDGFFPKA